MADVWSWPVYISTVSLLLLSCSAVIFLMHLRFAAPSLSPKCRACCQWIAVSDTLL